MIHRLRFLPALVLALACAIPAPAHSAAPKPFVDGDTVCFLGDSITHGGQWHRFIELFYASRFPERAITMVNCGIGGDQAGGALKRLDWDVLVHQPTVVVIMLGMNDIGHGSYENPNPTPEMLAAREKSITSYRGNMEALIKAIQARSKAAIILVKPSPYDETAELAKPARKGANGALGRCSEICEELAAAHGAAVVDFHGPMTRLMAEGQKIDPKYALVGGDRVHPGPPGHLVMASLFLRAQGFELNQPDKMPIATGVNDPVLARILPADQLMGSPGGKPADKDPRAKAAGEIAALSTERFTQGLRLRDIARMEVSIRGAGVNPADEAAVKAWMDARAKSLNPATDAGKAWERMATPYLMARAKREDILKKRAELLSRMRQLASGGEGPGRS